MAADGTSFPPFQTIPELDPATVLNFTDQVWINQNGADLRCNIGDLAALAPAGVTSFNNRRGAILLNAGDIVLAEGALLNSPAFQGVPLAPTAAPGTASGQIATTQFVANAIGAATPGVTSFNGRTGSVIMGLPDIVNAGGAPVTSPNLLGSPTAPTMAPGTSSTQLANCAFVTNAVAAMSPGVTSFNDRTGPVQLTLADITGVGGAPLSSPILVGVPQAPTQPPGADDNRIATCEFVQDAISSSVAGVTSFNGRQGAITLTTADITGAGGASAAQLSNYLPLTGGTLAGPGNLSVNGILTAAGNTFRWGQAGWSQQVSAAQWSFVAPNGSCNMDVNGNFSSNASLYAAGGVYATTVVQGSTLNILANGAIGGGLTVSGDTTIGGYGYATTPVAGDNSTKLATTQFVDEAIASAPGQGGTVTSVAMTVPNIFTITGSPITTAGTLAIGNRAQNANTVFAGPVSGGAMGGVFRALVAADIPSLSGTYLPLVGGTVTGPVVINYSLGSPLTVQGSGPNLLVNKTSAGSAVQVTGQNNGMGRWSVVLGDGDIETGGNTGSDFRILSYNDNGTSNQNALSIIRSTGAAAFAADLTVGGNIHANGNIIYWGANGWYQQVTAQWTFQAPNGSCYMDTNGNWLSNAGIYSAGLMQCGATLTVGGNIGIADAHSFNWGSSGRYDIVGSGTLYFYAGNGTYCYMDTASNFFAEGTIYGSSLNISGGAVIGGSAGAPDGTLELSAAAGNYREILFETSRTARWNVFVDNSPESGGNAGSNFAIAAYADNGNWISTPLTFTRSNGAANFGGNVNMQQGLAVANALSMGGQIDPAMGASGGINWGNMILEWGDAPNGAIHWGNTNGIMTSLDTSGDFNTIGGIGCSGPINSASYVRSNGGWVYSDAPAGTLHGYQITSGTIARWIVGSDGVAETGGNAGSNFAIYNYNDAGQNIGEPLSINRATGLTTLSGGLEINSVQATGAPSPGYAIGIDAPAGDSAFIKLNSSSTSRFSGINAQVGGVPRWVMNLTDGTAETGGNSGSNFVLVAMTDAGAQNGNPPLTISRATGVINTSTDLQIGGQLYCLVEPVVGAHHPVLGYFVNGSWYNAQDIGMNTTGSQMVVIYNASGESSTWSTTPSDRRLKSNLKPAGDALSFIKRLAVYDLDFKPRGKPAEGFPEPKVEHWPFSLIADEVGEVMPHAAMHGIDDDADKWVALHPTHLIATLWRAVQQLTEEVEALKAARA